MPYILLAQSNGIKYSVENETVVTQSNTLPFWLRANKFGSIPVAGTSTAFIFNAQKNYADTVLPHKFNWAYGIETRANLGQTSNLSIIQAYVKAKKGLFELKAGRYKDIVGMVDTTLSSGAFTISGNALGIPQVELSLPNYYNIPWFDKLFAIRAAAGIGYVGTLDIIPNFSANFHTGITSSEGFYEHQFIYLRLGKPSWRLKLFGGINHHVMFANEKKIMQGNYDWSTLETIIYAGIGKTYKGKSKVGNHIGSIDVNAQYEFENVRLMAYRQNIFDIGALAHLANIADGINGLSLTNKKFGARKIDWHKFLVEYVYTVNQAGYFASRFTPSGAENYYNNDEYNSGWTYYNSNLGNPLLASRQYTHSSLVTSPLDIIIDNRVSAIHTAFEGAINKMGVLVKLTYSKNFGTYATSPQGRSIIGIHYPPQYGLFSQINQFSGLLGVNKKFANGYEAGVDFGVDKGDLYYDSAGLLFKLKKTFN